MKLTKEDLNKSLEIQFQKDLKDLLEVVDLYNKSNKMLFENRLSKEEYETLNEGLWEKVKYGLSKLGRYKAGGKILGKGKIDQEAAAKIQTIIDKKGNEMIKALNSSIKEKNPEFPNNKKGQDFLNTVLEISAVYDSVVVATKKDPKEEGFLPIDAANTIIEDLGEYVKKFLDVDLSAAYSVMDSEKEKVDKDTELLTDEVEDINEDEAEDVRTKLQAKKGDAADRDSERMKTLKSNNLPLILTAVGGSLGTLGWLAQTDWLKTLLESWLNKKGIPGEDAIYQTFTGGRGGDPKGFLHWANQIDPSNPMKTGADVSNFVNKMGAENVSHMFDGNGAGDSMDQVSKLQQLVGGDNANKSVGELFQGDTYGDMKQGRNLFGISKAASFTAKVLIKQAVKGVAGSTAGTVLATKIASVGSVLAPLGIAVLATGALVKLMRMKGQKQSRAKTLQDLLNSIQPIKGTEQNQPVLPEQPKEDDNKKEEKGGEGKNNKEGLFNDLAGFFKFTYNNRKMASPELFGDKKEDLKENPCSKFTKGQKVKTKAGKAVEVIANSTEDDSIKKGEVKVKREDGGTYSVGCTQLSESMIKNNKLINEMSNNNLISEGKFIKDPEVIKILKQKSGIDQNKLKFFESFMTRVEIIRNKIKKMDNTGDKVIDKFVQKLKANPIMSKDFTKTFNVDPGNPQNVEAMGNFINELIEIVYKGKFRGMTFKDAGGMVGKMGTLGGGNINKVSMGESYLVERKGKKAKAKSDLKNNMISFITELMNMFQYMYKLKRQGKLSSSSDTKIGGTKKPTKTKPEPKQESVKKVNPLLTEEINKIKNLMFKIS